jgi:hypothetical protein
MGREARVKKNRECKLCLLPDGSGRKHNITADRMVEHWLYVKRLNKIGIISPEMQIEPIDRKIIVG